MPIETPQKNEKKSEEKQNYRHIKIETFSVVDDIKPSDTTEISSKSSEIQEILSALSEKILFWVRLNAQKKDQKILDEREGRKNFWKCQKVRKSFPLIAEKSISCRHHWICYAAEHKKISSEIFFSAFRGLKKQLYSLLIKFIWPHFENKSFILERIWYVMNRYLTN